MKIDPPPTTYSLKNFANEAEIYSKTGTTQTLNPCSVSNPTTFKFHIYIT